MLSVPAGDKFGENREWVVVLSEGKRRPKADGSVPLQYQAGEGLTLGHFLGAKHTSVHGLSQRTKHWREFEYGGELSDATYYYY